MTSHSRVLNGRLWQRPTLRADGGGRKVGWLELFFDLIFVVILAVLAHGLAEHLTVSGFTRFALQFMAVFWVWNAFTYYTERFESDGVDNRLFTFIAILAVAGLAVWGEDGLGHNYVGFAASYLLARALNIGLWLRAAYHERVFRPIATRFAGGFLLAVALIAGSFETDAGARLALWALAVVVEVGTPAVTVRLQSALPPISRDKFPERFGLLTIIVLGETVSGVIRGLSTANEEVGLTLRTVAQATLGLGIGFGLWWVYFDFIARRPTRPLFSVALSWVYLHLLTLTAIVTIGVAIADALGAGEDGTLPSELRVLLLSGVAAALLFMALLEPTLDRRPGEPSHRQLSPALKIAPAAFLVAVTLSGVPLTTSSALVVALLALMVPAAYAAFVTSREDQCQ